MAFKSPPKARYHDFPVERARLVLTEAIMLEHSFGPNSCLGQFRETMCLNQDVVSIDTIVTSSDLMDGGLVRRRGLFLGVLLSHNSGEFRALAQFTHTG